MAWQAPVTANDAMSHSATGVPERLVPNTPAWEMYYHEHRQRYEFFAEHGRGLTVLDAACGVGYGSQLLARAGADRVVGVDISPGSIGYAEQHFAAPGLQYRVGDVQNLDLEDASFDLAVSFETIEHVPHPEGFLREIRRVLKPDGMFICSTPNKEFHTEGHNDFHISEMTFDEFRSLFARYFSIEAQYHQSHSPAYLRHLEMISELRRVQRVHRSSWLLRLENEVRRRLKRDTWDTTTIAPQLERSVPGDFVIEPLERVLDTHLTLILTGHGKA